MSGGIGIFGDCFVEGFMGGGLLLVTRQGDVGTGFEELFPELEELSARLLKGNRRPVQTFEPSHTSRECSAYCSTMGRMLDVTIRCARLKL